MQTDGLSLISPSSVLSNVHVESGSSFPGSPTANQLFYINTDYSTYKRGLHIFENGVWDPINTIPDITVKANVASPSFTGVVQTAGNIMPTADGVVDLGSAALRFKGIYAKELYLSTNSLYLGDTKILGTDASTINIHADPNQHISMNVSGTGTMTMASEKSVTLSTSGTAADVYVQATGLSSNVRLSATNEVQLVGTTSLQGNVTTTGNHSVGGNLTLTGNLTVNGSTTVVNSTAVTVKDNIITLNFGEVGSGVTTGISGIQVDRGDLTDYQFVFDESDDMFKVGQIGSLQTIASQPWVTSNFSATSHNHSVDTLSNVTISNKQTNDVLKWNGTNWVNSASGGASTVDSLTNVTITNKAINDILQWNGTAWVNVASTSVGGGSSVTSMSYGGMDSMTLTTSATTANQVLDSISATTYRLAKYVITANSGSDYHTSEYTTTHDGTNAYDNETNVMYTNAALYTIDSDVSGGNLRLLVTPTNAVTTFKAVATYVKA